MRSAGALEIEALETAEEFKDELRGDELGTNELDFDELNIAELDVIGELENSELEVAIPFPLTMTATGVRPPGVAVNPKETELPGAILSFQPTELTTKRPPALD